MNTIYKIKNIHVIINFIKNIIEIQLSEHILKNK